MKKPLHSTGCALGLATNYGRRILVCAKPSLFWSSWRPRSQRRVRSEEHTSELQSQSNLVCRLLLEKKKKDHIRDMRIYLNTAHDARVTIAISATSDG